MVQVQSRQRSGDMANGLQGKLEDLLNKRGRLMETIACKEGMVENKAREQGR